MRRHPASGASRGATRNRRAARLRENGRGGGPLRPAPNFPPPSGLALGDTAGVAAELPSHLVPDSAARDLEAVASLHFDPEVCKWIEGYEEVGPRSEFLWRWCRHGLELITLSCVEPELRSHVCDTKLLNTMLGVLLDDVADRTPRTDPAQSATPDAPSRTPESAFGQDRFLDMLLAMVSDESPPRWHTLTPDERSYADFTHGLWEACRDRLKSYPCFKAYDALLRYDYLQILNAMRYARLVNGQVHLLNPIEHDLYQPHNMQMMSFATIDLMCSPKFLATELGKLRQAMWHAQYMGRIGNLVSTWQREVLERDYTSGVFAHALVNDDLTAEQLAEGDRRPIEAAIQDGGYEESFLRRWEYHRGCLLSMRGQFRSVSLERLIEGLERLLCMELGTRGLR